MKVLIVGAGIAGLALAKALEGRGIVADPIEKQEGAPTLGASLYLPGNAARALRAVGVLDEVTRAAHRIRRQEFYASSGQLLNTVEVGRFWSEESPCLSIERNALRAILEASLERARVRYGQHVTQLEQRADGVHVWFANGSSDHYDLVVGCDGIDSSVRRHVFPNSMPRFCGQVCWRVLVNDEVSFSDWHVMLGPGTTLLAVALPGSRLYLYADTVAVDPANVPETPAGIFGNYPGKFAKCARVLSSEGVYRSLVEEVSLEQWHRGQVLLIGDAAHASRPNMAEGAAMALEDAHVLAEMLAKAGPSETLLDTFVARRRPRVDWVQRQTRARDRLRSSPSVVRNTVLRFGARRLHDRTYAPLRSPV
jgi:2-heptyl-3-hydroxy-4(1H)-quinolone synthase